MLWGGSVKRLREGMAFRRSRVRGKKGLKFISWREFRNMTTSERKRAFVAWLMKRGVSLNEARLICWRKFYHGDPFERTDDEQSNVESL
jgi:hypothetical protein